MLHSTNTTLPVDAAAALLVGPDTTGVIADPQTGPASERRGRPLSSWVTMAAFFGMHVAAVCAILFVPFTWTGLALAVGLHVLRGFGLTAGFHRYFAHRAYKTGRVFQFLLAWFGAMSLQRGAIWWAGHHRIHHKHSDQDEDPHSPISGTIWWSHVGWVLSDRFNDVDWDLMKDFKKYPELKWLERFDLVPGVLTGVFCFLVGGLVALVTATAAAGQTSTDLFLGGAWSGLFWGFFLGTVFLYHSTFMVNSVCHLLGKRRFNTDDYSRNNWFVAILTLGEGWHNNHHHYPSAARQGFYWWEFDMSYCILTVLSWFGVVWDLRQPTPRALAAKRADANVAVASETAA